MNDMAQAIQSSFGQAGINYFIDPKLFTAADGTTKPEPVLTLHWEHYTAANALARVLKENHLFMVTNDFTTVVLITAAKTISHTVDAKLLGSDTNGVIPIIKFSYVPLDQALTAMINHAHLPIVLDPRVTGEQPAVADRAQSLADGQVGLAEGVEYFVADGFRQLARSDRAAGHRRTLRRLRFDPRQRHRARHACHQAEEMSGPDFRVNDRQLPHVRQI